MYQIAICDDEKIFTDKLAHMIKQYSNAHHHVIDLHLFQQAADFIQSSLESYDNLTVSGRKTPAQPTDADSTSYYIDWYEKSFPVASEWRAAPIGP